MNDMDAIEYPTELQGTPPETGVTRGIRSIPFVMANLVHSVVTTAEGKGIREAPKTTVKALSGATGAAAVHNKELEEAYTFLQARIDELEDENKELKNKVEQSNLLKNQILSLLKTPVDLQEKDSHEVVTKETKQAPENTIAKETTYSEDEPKPLFSRPLLEDLDDSPVKTLEVELQRLDRNAQNQASTGLASKLRKKLPIPLIRTNQRQSRVYSCLLALVILLAWSRCHMMPIATVSKAILVNGEIPSDTVVFLDVVPDDIDSADSAKSLTILADGRVKVGRNSESIFQSIGFEILEDEVRQVLRKFEEVDFYSFHNDYGITSEHCVNGLSMDEEQGFLIISLTAHGVIKRVFYHTSCRFEREYELGELVDAIVEVELTVSAVEFLAA
jgi:hypothetical protein